VTRPCGAGPSPARQGAQNRKDHDGVMTVFGVPLRVVRGVGQECSAVTGTPPAPGADSGGHPSPQPTIGRRARGRTMSHRRGSRDVRVRPHRQAYRHRHRPAATSRPPPRGVRVPQRVSISVARATEMETIEWSLSGSACTRQRTVEARTGRRLALRPATSRGASRDHGQARAVQAWTSRRAARTSTDDVGSGRRRGARTSAGGAACGGSCGSARRCASFPSDREVIGALDRAGRGPPVCPARTRCSRTRVPGPLRW
jgi:hypothetical protein